MKTLILYNGVNVFSGVGPVPFTSFQDTAIRFHDRWALGTQIKLAGVVTGLCGNDLSGLVNNQKTLTNNFSQDCKELTIVENGQTIFSAPYSVIESVNFSQDRYVRAVPYEITLNCYQTDLFSGVYGVAEPENKTSYQEGEDGIVTVSRSISARGFNTNSQNTTNNGFDNAKTWVQTRTGWNPTYFSLPYFIQYQTGIVPCVKSQQETIDRFNNFYSIEEQYKFNSKATSPIIIKYSTEIGYEENQGIYEVDIKGEIEGCPTQAISGSRAAYKSLDLYSIANYEYKKCYPLAPDLHPEFLSDSVEENPSRKVISFSRSYDSDLRSPVQFDYDISIEYDVLTDLYTASLNGVIRSRNSQKVKWDRVLNYYENNVNAFQIVNTFYVGNGYPYALVSYPTSYSVGEDKFKGEITIQATYNNRLYPQPGFEDFDYTVEIAPSINQLLPIPVICGNYTLLDLNALKRARISINGNAFSLDNNDLSSELSVIAKSILNQFIETPAISRVPKEDQISKKIEAQGKSYQFNYAETYMGPEFTL